MLTFIANPEHVIFRRLFPGENAYALALLSLEDLAHLFTTRIQAERMNSDVEDPSIKQAGLGIDNGAYKGKKHANKHRTTE